MSYVGWDGREYEDAEMDNMIRDAREDRMHQLRKRPLTPPQRRALEVAWVVARRDHFLTLYDVDRYTTIRSLLARGYLARRKGAPNCYDITEDGMRALDALKRKGWDRSVRCQRVTSAARC
jgi:hypothetical protein